MNNIYKIGVVMLLLLSVAAVFALKPDPKAPDSSIPKEISNTPTPLPEQKLNLPLLLDLGAKKCIPCKMMIPVLDELKKEYAGKIEVMFIDVWETPEAKSQYGIQLIPTQIFFDAAGKELYRHEGFYSKKDIAEKWESLGIHLR